MRPSPLEQSEPPFFIGRGGCSVSLEVKNVLNSKCLYRSLHSPIYPGDIWDLYAFEMGSYMRIISGLWDLYKLPSLLALIRDPKHST